MRATLIANDSTYVYNLRREVIEALLNNSFEVYIICQEAQHMRELTNMGCHIIAAKLERQGTNPVHDITLMHFYYKALKKLQPQVVLTYNIKPNVYAGSSCAMLGIPYLSNVCGLGMALEYPGALQKITSVLYRWGLRKAACVFFQNEENQRFFQASKLINCKEHLLPGSGVNTNNYKALAYPCGNTIDFLFISRVMKDKGADQYLSAAEIIRAKYPNTVFHVIGGCDDSRYLQVLDSLQKKGIIKYHGQQKSVLPFHQISSCTIHPTYYPEGMSNVLLESAACGRPIITTDRSGCREIVEHGINGFICNQKDTQSLVKQIESFLALSWEQRKNMGLAGRAKVKKEFDRQIVVDAYIKEIMHAVGKEESKCLT